MHQNPNTPIFRSPKPNAQSYLGGVSLDLEQLRVLEYDCAVGLLCNGRWAAEGLAVGLGKEVFLVLHYYY